MTEPHTVLSETPSGSGSHAGDSPTPDPIATPTGTNAAVAASTDQPSGRSAGIRDTTPGSETLEARIQQLEAQVATLKDQALRAMADTENTRRRAQREREDTAKFAVANFAKELVAVADNLRRALEAVPAETRQDSDSVNNLCIGVEATERQLAAAFERAGIQKQEPLGEPFDPNFHQVMFEVPNTGKPAGTVVQVLQVGYTIHGRLLREAMVGVAQRGGDEPEHVNTSA